MADQHDALPMFFVTAGVRLILVPLSFIRLSGPKRYVPQSRAPRITGLERAPSGTMTVPPRSCRRFVTNGCLFVSTFNFKTSMLA